MRRYPEDVRLAAARPPAALDDEVRWRREEQAAVRAGDHAAAAIFHARRWRALDAELAAA